MSKIYANWSISLDTECPKCEEYFDLIEQDDDFWIDGGRAGVCEHDTPRTTDVEVECPSCEHKFKVDFCY
ncbi:hypothetical protein MHZ90_14700 [Pantoea sp. ACRSH]|uniref:hypothetical protein n=1 Tax=unclassified Pantoea TaxID=2630326 RepID=UPI001EF528B0|nr:MULTISPECIES: hypothetical protein [unclassified Pantoea]MCG7367370.1 hypothetical protein [Pantoea sp. ACRSH]MCG7397663.1 hypothetical protein [Pantoea sp. ACRSC]